MKAAIKFILQKTFGIKRYLLIFSRYKIRTLRNDKKENDFFYFLELLPKNKPGVVLDVGANLGVMTYHMASCSDHWQVHAIEPFPLNQFVLKANIEKYQLTNVTVNPIAIGDREGVVRMVMPVKSAVKYHGLVHVLEEGESAESGEVIEVPLKTLDQLELEGPVLGIKIDVENYESRVIEGAHTLLTQWKPIVYCELWENDNRNKTILLMESIGYKTMVPWKGEVVMYNPNQHNTQNFIFVAD